MIKTIKDPKMVFIKINFKNQEICCGSLSKKGKILTFGDSNGILGILNLNERFKNIKIFKTHDLEITKIKLMNSKIFSCSYDAKLKIWDLQKQKLINIFTDHSGPINDLDIYEKLICTSSEDGDLRLWDLRIKKSITKIKHGFNLIGCKFLNNKNLMVTHGISNFLYLWDLRMNKVFYKKLKVLKNSKPFILSICVSECSNFMFVLDSECKIHRIKNQGEERFPRNVSLIEKQNDNSNILRFLLKLNLDEGCTSILNGDFGGKSYIRSIKSGKILYQFNDHLKTVKEVIYNLSKKIFVSVGMDGSIVIRTFFKP